MNDSPVAPQWTYLRQDEEAGLLESEQAKLPPKETVFLAFDTFRWKVQVGVRESGGYMSLLLPEINDDCNIVAWAPLGITAPMLQSSLISCQRKRKTPPLPPSDAVAKASLKP